MGLKDNKETFVFNVSRDWKPMEMFRDVRRYRGGTGKSGNESRSRLTGFMILYHLVVSAYLAFAIFVLVVYSLFSMVTEIKSFYLILLTR